MSSVALRGLTKSYGDEPVVHRLDLDIADGELMVVVGPSGCGKTTVLRMVAGLEPVTAGDVLVDGTSVVGVSSNDRDMAMVFQEPALYPHMTVGENLAFPLRMAGLRRAEVEHRVQQTALMIGVHDLLQRSPRRLSGGQRQRVAIGRALIRRPQLLLMDEPMSNLDAKLRTDLRSAIGHLQHRLGVTTIYITHDQVEAMALGHRIAIMRQGRVVQCGRPDDLYHRPADAFVGSFIGSPPMNLMIGTIDGGGQSPSVRIGRTGLSLSRSRLGRLASLDGHTVVVGVRAQALRFTDGAGLDVDVLDVDQSSGRCTITASVGSDAVVIVDRGVRVEHRPAPIRLDLDGDDQLDLALWKRSTLTVHPDDIHLFDPVTGRSLLVDDFDQETDAAT